MKIAICHLSSVHTRYDIRIFRKECKSLSNYFNTHLIVADGLGNEVKENISILDTGEKSTNTFLRMALTPWKVYRMALSLKHCRIFHFHDPELLLVGYALQVFHGKKVVYDVHEDVPQDILLKHWIPKRLRIIISYLYKKIENFVAKRISLIVCSTPFIQQRLVKINPNTIDVKNYPDIKSQLIVTKKNRSTYDVCYIGTISANRGIISILNILDRITAKFVLAGVFDNNTFEKELRAHPNWGRVNYLGVLDAAGVKDLLEVSKIGIVVLDNTPTFVESLPIKLFEYMASGLAIIASDFPLWKEIVEGANCGVCISPSDEEKLLESIKFLLANEDLVSQMGVRGAQAVEALYTWENEFAKLLASYNRLL